jgi:hypothetical protein
MPETASVAITTVLSVLVIVNIVGNSLVCAIIKRNRDMRYVENREMKSRVLYLNKGEKPNIGTQLKKLGEINDRSRRW